MPFSLPSLPYSYDALEPFIDARTMEIHHTKHHQAYVDNANKLLAGTPWQDKSAREILTHLQDIPEDIRTGVHNNVGGLCNHHFFWVTIGKNKGGSPSGDLAEGIEKAFGSFEAFQEAFEKSALTRFGSGWAWLVVDAQGALKVISLPNQDSPLALGYERIIGLDVWEHAYYLHYQNRRAEYVKAFWNIVDWEAASSHFEKAIATQSLGNPNVSCGCD